MMRFIVCLLTGIIVLAESTVAQNSFNDIMPASRIVDYNNGSRLHAESESANLAKYYAGICYLKKGEYISAVDYLEQFSSDDLLVQARAFALIGDAYMEMENYDDAVSWYNKARNYKPNENSTPLYLLKAATAYEMLEDWESALECYEIITTKYVNSGEYQDARKHKARVETLVSG